MTKTFDAVGIGWIVLDHLSVLPSYPVEDTKSSMLESCEEVGGPVTRAMMTLSRLGKLTSLVAKVGDDRSGMLARESLCREGIELGALESEENGRSRLSTVWIAKDTGTRTIAYSEGSLGDLDLTLKARERIRRARILHLDGREPSAALQAVQLARKSGCQVTLDAGRLKPGLENLIPLVDVVVVPADFVAEFAPGSRPVEVGEKLIDMGARNVILTRGSEGAIAVSRDDVFYQPAFLVDVVDTNGAGDSFCGGLLFGLLQSWDMQDSVRFASGVAALKCRHLGNQGIPRLADVEEFLRPTLTRE